MAETIEDYLTGYYKVISKDLVQRGFQYKVGLNVDSKEFDPKSKPGGGLHFTTGDFLFKMLVYGDMYVEVTIPEGEQVVKVNSEIRKAHRICISEPKPIAEFPLWKNTEYCINSVTTKNCYKYFNCPITADLAITMFHDQRSADMIDWIAPKITDEIARKIISADPFAIQYLRQNLELCRLAFEKNITCFPYLKFTDRKMQEEAIEFRTEYADYVSDLDDETLFKISKKRPSVIKRVKVITPDMWNFIMSKANGYYSYMAPSYEIYKQAITLSPKCYQDIITLKSVEPYAEELTNLAVGLRGNNITFVPSKFRTTELYKLAVKQSPRVVLYKLYNGMADMYEMALRIAPDIYPCLPYDDKSKEALQNIVLEIDGMMLGHIHNPTEKSYEIAFRQTPNAIRFIPKKSQTIAQIVEALKTDYTNIAYVDQRIELCLMTVMSNFLALRHINLIVLKKRYPDQYQTVIMTALKQNPDVISHVRHELQTMEMQELAVEYDGKNIAYCADHKNEILCLKAVESNPMALEVIKNQTDVVIKTALSKMGLAYKYVKNKSDEYKQIAVKQNPLVAKYF